MSNEQEMDSPLHAKYKIITDKKIIDGLNKLPLYVAPNETEETYDKDILSGKGHDLKKSSEEVGQLRPIEVAVWFDDPNKDSDRATDRIHMRIINGRHRYKFVPEWRREYYDFSEFVKQKINPVEEYYYAKGHFDMQKKASKSERAVWAKDMCEMFMKEGTPPHECCKKLVEKCKQQGISNENSIREVCSAEFKDKEMMSRKMGKTFESKGMDTKEIKKLKKVAGEKFVDMESRKLKLESENTQLQKEIIGLRDDNKKGVNVQEDLQQQLRLVANIGQEHVCKCGHKSKLTVDASSGKVLVKKA